MTAENATSSSIARRAVLLAQAIELCTKLSAVLDEIGPSRSTRCDSTIEGQDKLREVYALEEKLHRKLQTVNERRNDVLAPISRVPEDVLHLSFTFPSSEKWLDSCSLGFTLSSVCRRWRAIALNTAALWAYASYPTALHDAPHPGIHASPYAWYEPTSVKALAYRDETSFLRSKAASITVNLLLDGREDMAAVIAQFRTECTDRVVHLETHVMGLPHSLPALITCIMAARSTLQKLNASFSWGATGEIDDVSSFMAMDLPLLHDVTLRGLTVPNYSQQPYLALLRCKALGLCLYSEDHFTDKGFVILLQSCPVLEELRLSVFAQEPSSPFSGAQIGRVNVPKLKHLALYGAHDVLASALSNLQAPSLSHLLLRSCLPSNDERSSPLWHSVLEFVQASSAPVQDLNMQSLPAIFSIDLLQFLPTVTSFTFEFQERADSVYAELLGALTMCTEDGGGPGGEWALPHFEELSLPKWTAGPSNLEMLWKLCRKCAGTKPIKRIRLAPNHRLLSSPDITRHDVTRQMEQNLAEEIEELIVAAGDKEWVFDKAMREWRRRARRGLDARFNEYL